MDNKYDYIKNRFKDDVKRDDFGNIVYINGIFIPSGANSKFIRFFYYKEIFELIDKLKNRKFIKVVNNKSFPFKKIKSSEDIIKNWNKISFRKSIIHSILISNRREIIKKLLIVVKMIKEKKLYDHIIDFLKKIDVLFDYYTIKTKDKFIIKKNKNINNKVIKFKIINISSKNISII